MAEAKWKTELSDYLDGLCASSKSKQYVGDVRRYMTHLAKFVGISSFSDLTREHVVKWMAELKENGSGKKPGGGMKTITVKFTIGKLKTFVRHLNGGEFPSWVRNLPRLKVGNMSKVKTPDELLTKREVRAIAGELRQPWKAAFLVLAVTGARPTEILTLEVGDVSEPKTDENGVRRDIAIRDSKSGEPRTVWVYGRAMDALGDALSRADKYVFPNRKGEPKEYTTYGHTLRRAAKNAGIKKRVYPYLTRHTFVTDMLREGVKDKAIMAMTGHASRAMLDHYGHLTQEETLKEIAPHLSGGEVTDTVYVEAEIERRIGARMAEERAKWDAENEATISRFIDERFKKLVPAITGMVSGDDDDPAPTEAEVPPGQEEFPPADMEDEEDSE